MPNREEVCIHWFRRDLRLDDNASLFHALKSGKPALCLFIFDADILEELQNKKDARVEFIHQKVSALSAALHKMGSTLLVSIGKPLDVFKELCENYLISEVYTNHDYEPYARYRDAKVKDFLESKGIAFKTHKDQVVFEKDEILNNSGAPYSVFTPYGRKWNEALETRFQLPFNCKRYYSNLFKTSHLLVPSLKEIGFEETGMVFPSEAVPDEIIQNHQNVRDKLPEEGTSRLGIHLRFGTVSIRQLVLRVKEQNPVFLNELKWREFFQMILWHFPHVIHSSFRPAYDAIPWRNNEEEFDKWCRGVTGYPVVDAGMRELNSTGFMHNRARMITASFLCKHLLIDWRWGEQYFAERLLDFELASNNGNWQWAAGTGCDAAPYFRIFSPAAQQKRFDPDSKYIRKWVPEYGTPEYPIEIVPHNFARKRALETYKSALK